MRTPRPTELLVCLSLVGLGAGLGACSEAAKTQFEARAAVRKRQLEEKVLRDRVEGYWEAVRWSQWQEASTYFLESKDQVQFLRTYSSRDKAVQSGQDTQIQYIFVDPDTMTTAEVRVGWTTVDATRGRVDNHTFTQAWIKRQSRWWMGSVEQSGPEEETR